MVPAAYPAAAQLTTLAKGFRKVGRIKFEPVQTRKGRGNMRRISEALVLTLVLAALLLYAVAVRDHNCYRPNQSLLFARGASACLQSLPSR